MWEIMFVWAPLTCTQSCGRGGTEVQELHKLHKTWSQTKETLLLTCNKKAIKCKHKNDHKTEHIGFVYYKWQ